MKQEFILHSTSKEELTNLIAEAIKSELASFNPIQKDYSNKLYTRKEVSKLLDISLPTLNEWTKNGTIRAYRIGNSKNIRYREKDIQNALIEIRTLKYARK